MAGTELKGHGLIGSMEAVVRLSNQQTADRILDACPTVGPMLRQKVIVSSGWYPIELYVELTEAMRAELGPEISVKIGRETTIADVNSIFRFVLRLFSPQTLGKMAPRVFSTYCRGANASYEVRSDKEMVFTFSDFSSCTQGIYEEYVAGSAMFMELGGGTNARGQILEGGKTGDTFVRFSVAWD